MENPRGVRQRDAIGDNLTARVDLGNLRPGRRAELAQHRVDVSDVNARAIGRGCGITSAMGGDQAARNGAAGKVHHGHVIAQPVGDVERAAAIERDSGRLETGRQGAQRLHRRGVDFADRVRPRISDIEARAIGRDGDAARHFSNRDAAGDGALGGIDGDHFAGAAQHRVEARAVWRYDQIIGTGIAGLRGGHRGENEAGENRSAPWRTHSCVPRRDFSRRVFVLERQASARLPTRHARVRAPRLPLHPHFHPYFSVIVNT